MNRTVTAESQVQIWFEQYQKIHKSDLSDPNIYMPIWQMLALASEIHDKNGPLDFPDEVQAKLERITTISQSLMERQKPLFPSEIVLEIENIAREFATTRSLPPFNP